MKSNTKIRILVCFLCMFYISCMFSNNGIFDLNQETANPFSKFDDNLNIKHSGYWDLTGTPILIDNDGGTAGAITWTAAVLQPWCSFDGVFYVIENVTINGQNSGSCIYIIDSVVPFIIRNCTLYNSGSVSNDAGIKLDYASNAKLINNSVLYNNGDGINAANSNNITVSRNIANYNTMYGIGIEYGNTINVSESTANNNGERGISLDFCTNSTISTNTANNNDYAGIRAYQGNTIIMKGNTANNNNNYGLSLGTNNNNEILGCTAINNKYGVSTYSSDNNIISGNLFNDNTLWHYNFDSFNNEFSWNVIDGVAEPFIIDDTGSGNFTWSQAVNQLAWVEGLGSQSDPYVIEDLIIDGKNSSSCIEVRNSNASLIIRNCEVYNSGQGIRLYLSINSTVSRSIIYDNTQYGLCLDRSNNTLVTGNIFNYNGINWYYENNSKNNTLIWNVVDGVSDPFTIDDTEGGDFTWAQAINQLAWIYGSGTVSTPYLIEGLIIDGKNSSSCIEVRNSTAYFIIRNCKVYNSSQGIRLYSSDNSTVISNIINNNTQYGLYLDHSNKTLVLGNIFNYNGIDWHYENNSSNNTYSWNVIDRVLDPFIIDDTGGGNFTWTQAANQFAWVEGLGSQSDPHVIEDLIIDGKNSSSCIEISNSSAYFIIRDCVLYNSSQGVYPFNAGIMFNSVSNGILSNNDASYNNYRGISLWASDNNTISKNTANYNDFGIYFNNGSTNNVVSDNNINYNNQYGIYLINSSNNTVIGNTADYNEYGIFLTWSNSNTISGNIVNNNNQFGINLDACNNTVIFNNTFSGNYINAQDDNGFGNQWYNGTIGNRWGDYGGLDVNDDGIGDTVYIISGTSGFQDNYPILWDAPIISLILPITNNVFSHISPNFAISMIEGIVDSIWYTLDYGLTNVSSSSLTGTIDYIVWVSLPEGLTVITFYVNDSQGYIDSVSVTIHKDLNTPTISINQPNNFEVFGKTTPEVEIVVTDIYLDSIWYSLSSAKISTANYTWNGTIAQEVWDQMGNGIIIIRFYANDTLGNIGTVDVVVTKRLPSQPGIPGYNLFLLIGIISIISIILIRKQKEI